MSHGVFGCHPAAATSLRPFPTLSCTTWSVWASISAPAPPSGSSHASSTTVTSVSGRLCWTPFKKHSFRVLRVCRFTGVEKMTAVMLNSHCSCFINQLNSITCFNVKHVRVYDVIMSVINSSSVSPSHRSLQSSLGVRLSARRPAVGEGAVSLCCQQEVLSGGVLSGVWTHWPLDNSNSVQHTQSVWLPGLACFYHPVDLHVKKVHLRKNIFIYFSDP